MMNDKELIIKVNDNVDRLNDLESGLNRALVKGKESKRYAEIAKQARTGFFHRKEALEALQNVALSGAETDSITLDLIAHVINYLREKTIISDEIIQLATANIAENRAVIQHIRNLLEGKTARNLDQATKEELLSILKKLKSNEDYLLKQEKMEKELGDIKKRVLNLENGGANLVEENKKNEIKGFDPSKYIISKAKALPIILLLDNSGSMIGEKIATLNEAVNKMIASFKQELQNEVEIQVGIITFGAEGAKYEVPLRNCSDILDIQLGANGGTPLGMALKLAKDLIENKEIISKNSYRPAVVLVSDGEPTDYWKEPLDQFINHGRSSKCDRLALEIQAGAKGIAVLNKFLEGTNNPLFHADDAVKIKDFFRFVTMSVSVRSKSVNPNKLLLPSEIDSVQKKINSMMDF